MNRSLFLASVALLSTGCGGFGLTPGAVHCGIEPTSGMDVWVDGVGIDPAVPLQQPISLADGGTQTTVSVPYMTCQHAFETVTQAMAIGDQNGFWEKKDEWGFLNGQRVEFINSWNLQGVPGISDGINNDGQTSDALSTHDMAIAYESDEVSWVPVPANYSAPYVMGQATWGSAVVLVHEMTHALQSQGFMDLGGLHTDTNNHCNWSTKFAPLYRTLGWAQMESNFLDECNKNSQGWVMSCSGSYCNYQSQENN